MTSTECHFEPLDQCESKPVVIVGNGPSGITLSFLLAGHWPYYDQTSHRHPIEFLHHRLTALQCKSLLEANLDQLSQGLSGRSLNPVSLLFDQLQHPETDFGSDQLSVLRWEHHSEKAIDHVVLGTGLPGGVWHQIGKTLKRNQLKTVSRARWMQLPDLAIVDNHKPEASQRIQFEAVADYYRHYVNHFHLNGYFRNFTKVVRIEWNEERKCYVVDAVQSCPITPDGLASSRTGRRIRYFTANVVLATGASNSPARLNISGERDPFVIHSLDQFDTTLRSYLGGKGKRHWLPDPVLIVGSGLSAADAITLVANRCKRPFRIIHIFRRSINDRSLIFTNLNNENLFPDYHYVYNLMKKSTKSPYCVSCVAKFGCHYQAYQQCVLTHYNPVTRVATLEFCADKASSDFEAERCCCKCRLPVRHQTSVRVSLVCILVGSKPELNFLSNQILANLHCPDTALDVRNVHINPITYQCSGQPGLYAVGPLVGDNFVRFVQGGSFAAAKDIIERYKP